MSSDRTKTRGQGDWEKGRQGDQGILGLGDTGTRRRGDKETRRESLFSALSDFSVVSAVSAYMC